MESSYLHDIITNIISYCCPYGAERAENYSYMWLGQQRQHMHESLIMGPFRLGMMLQLWLIYLFIVCGD